MIFLYKPHSNALLTTTILPLNSIAVATEVTWKMCSISMEKLEACLLPNIPTWQQTTLSHLTSQILQVSAMTLIESS